MLLDDLMPVYDINEVHWTAVQAPPESIFHAIKEVTPAEILLLRTLVAIRSLPSLLMGKGGLPGLPFASTKPFLEQALAAGFVLLAEAPSREMVLGIVGQFWKPSGGLLPRIGSAQEFTAFDNPGYAKAALNFYIDSRVGHSSSILRTETRVHIPDAASRRRFRVYWSLIYPGSALIRKMWLRAIKRRAERSRVLYESVESQSTGFPAISRRSEVDRPIVLIHGIKGSHLAQTYDDSFDVIYSGVQKAFESIWDIELDEAGEVEKDIRDVISVMRIEVLAYGELLGRLRKKFPGNPVYIFRYDWRLDNKHNALKLREFLQYLRKKTHGSSFRFVAHSMGGLILAAFLRLDPPRHLPLVDRAVLAAPPLHGAPKAMSALIIGEASLFSLNSSEAFRKIARTFPSVYQLVPGYRGAWDHHDADADIWNLHYWQRRVVLDGRPEETYKERDELMHRHLERAREFHSKDLIDFDALEEGERKKYIVLYGRGERTLVKIAVKPENSTKEIANFFDFDAEGNYSMEGDGTVPVVSALRFSRLTHHKIDLENQAKWWLPTTWDDAAKMWLAGFHGGFLALDKVQGIVVDWLGGKDVQPSWSSKIVP